MLKNILKGAGFFVIMGALFLLMVYVFELLWNITVPELFGLKSMNYGMAFRVLLLARILTGSFNFRWNNSGEKGKFWRERMKMKMDNMSEEERSEFKRKLWHKCQD
jgi:hypothetical protein